MKVRLRDAHSPETLAAMYAMPHDHTRYGNGHHLRVEMTKVMCRWLADVERIRDVADLSCGNAAIARSIRRGQDNVPHLHLGDFTPEGAEKWGYQYGGPIEETIAKIPRVDLFICSETLEHLDDPATVLRLIRSTAGALVLTTPIDAFHDTNAEHYWAWDRDGVELMLAETMWNPILFNALDTRPLGEPYCYGMWVCQ